MDSVMPTAHLAQDPDPDPEAEAIEKLLASDKRVASDFTVSKTIKAPSRQWDIFYKSHQNNFFKDRHWTDREFSVLAEREEEASRPAEGSREPAQSGPGAPDSEWQDSLVGNALDCRAASGNGNGDGNGTVLLEVGCGVGNMCFPLLEKDPNLKVHCCDFSPRAIDLVKGHPKYDPVRVNAFVHDLTGDADELRRKISLSEIGSPCLISLIFVLSAIPPGDHFQVLSTLVSLLPKGGSLLFRDYAYGDLSQLRFHSTDPNSKKETWNEPNRLHEEKNWYRRGDGTLTYFFKLEELNYFAEKLGLKGEIKIVDKSVINRKLQIEMKRKWLQVQWKKS